MALYLRTLRQFSTYSRPVFRPFSSQVPKPKYELTEQEKLGREADQKLSYAGYHRVSNAERTLFVLAGMYKNKADVPEAVPAATLEKCRNIIRIRGCTLMMIVLGIGAFGVCVAGKKERDHLEQVARESARQSRNN